MLSRGCQANSAMMSHEMMTHLSLCTNDSALLVLLSLVHLTKSCMCDAFRVVRYGSSRGV